MRVIAVIPARGGSKGIPKKNLVNIAGQPLIYYSIIPALGSVVDAVVVSTDDPDIAEVSRDLGAEVRDRPERLAGDWVPTEPVVVDVINNIIPSPKDDDVVVLLQPTSPIRDAELVDKCIACYIKELNNGHDAVFTAHYERYYHWKIGSLGWDGTDFTHTDARQPRQGAARDVRENGNVFVTRVGSFCESNRFGYDPTIFFTLPMFGVELDEPWEIPMVSSLVEYCIKKEIISLVDTPLLIGGK